MSEKKVIDVTTEIEKGRGDFVDDVMHVLSIGLLPGSTSDHYSTTVTYDDSTISNGTGSTKEEAIRNALQQQ